MPWPQHHKARTRERIVRSAAAAFRARGVDGVRVEDVMARAGLTHGGFYAHFASKDDLLRQALAHADAQTREMLSRLAPGTPGADRTPDLGPRPPDLGPFQRVIDAYLSAGHAAHPEVGCPLPTLGPEIARAGGTTRRRLADAVKNRLAWMRELLPEERRRAADRQVIGALACMVGGLVLARAAGPRDRDAILRVCREFLHEALARPPDRARAARRKVARKRRRS